MAPRLAVIDEDLCIGCAKCIQACPVDAIVGAPPLMHTVIASWCTGCELCIPPCPVDCISLVAVDALPDPPFPRALRWRVRRLARDVDERAARLASRNEPRQGARRSSRAPAAAMPEPKSELEYATPYELLVAVVLSAQATDKSVNLATAKLFPVANTPAKIAALGAEGLENYIRTIGLYRGKAKNVIALEDSLRRSDEATCHRTRRSKRCPASGARPTWSPERGSRRAHHWPSIRTSSASPTAPGSRPARTRSKSRRSSSR